MEDEREAALFEVSNEPISHGGGGGGGGGGEETVAKKKKVVVVMGATGAGKSRLAIDLVSHFSGVEVVNADSMQVYRGLDVVTNKVPLSDRNGSIDPSVEFTSRDFRDLSIPIIDDILSRDGLPVVVGGTNYYIQALVSPFLVDDVVEHLAACSLDGPQELGGADEVASFERLKEIDPVAANRIHPNDHRKIKGYLNLYESSGVLPSNLFQGVNAEACGNQVLRGAHEWEQHKQGRGHRKRISRLSGNQTAHSTVNLTSECNAMLDCSLNSRGDNPLSVSGK
ncbi:IPP transferase [Musa troglodytarum]|uniref:IPP transferase n=1 Tax=Musa troglodytarum TaxID=320322 RepID=A0A9E7EM14_9LILI|nr:IPP transferase [Musa troglodytarum]